MILDDSLCLTCWGSHACYLERGHQGDHECDCCRCEDHARDHEREGCVAKPPYYGPVTEFFELLPLSETP